MSKKANRPSLLGVMERSWGRLKGEEQGRKGSSVIKEKQVSRQHGKKQKLQAKGLFWETRKGVPSSRIMGTGLGLALRRYTEVFVTAFTGL